MDIAALKAFITVAETGSFSLAADRLFLTQPAVSKRVAVLERELDARLFDRIGRTVSLTEAGSALLPRARNILLELADSVRAISNLSGEVHGTLRFGTSHHIGLHRLPPALKQFTQLHPRVRMDIRFMDSEAACEAVEHGELELGVVTLPPHPSPNLTTRLVWSDPLAVVVANDVRVFNDIAGTYGFLGPGHMAAFAYHLQDKAGRRNRTVSGLNRHCSLREFGVQMK